MKLIETRLFQVIALIFVVGTAIIVLNSNIMVPPLPPNNNDDSTSSSYFDLNESLSLAPPANFSDVMYIYTVLAPCDINISDPPYITDIYAFFYRNGSLKIIKNTSGPNATSYEETIWSSYNVTLLKTVFDMFYDVLGKGEVLTGDHEYLFPGSILGIDYAGNISDGVKIQSPLFDNNTVPVKFVRIDSKAYHYLFLSNKTESDLVPIFKLLMSVVYPVLTQQ